MYFKLNDLVKDANFLQRKLILLIEGLYIFNNNIYNFSPQMYFS